LRHCGQRYLQSRPLGAGIGVQLGAQCHKSNIQSKQRPETRDGPARASLGCFRWDERRHWSLNVFYAVEESRAWWKQKLVIIALTLVLAALIILALILVL
jgi:hypothetical protein